ncbi:hypothetical protein DCS_06994 [Drechmeria coniospora]|uniref:Uncharacterized protein n=1 Tax=Drechmeria coniospora TaxID=98403 RepID=A0A151GD95_DRECN|nr:hypothetical protein DCS_06994 [Drechmeria coniospora]KYK55033.1 hypothetical protein DCS_06994 [Drechmeria coniospora]
MGLLYGHCHGQGSFGQPTLTAVLGIWTGAVSGSPHGNSDDQASRQVGGAGTQGGGGEATRQLGRLAVWQLCTRTLPDSEGRRRRRTGFRCRGWGEADAASSRRRRRRDGGWCWDRASDEESQDEASGRMDGGWWMVDGGWRRDSSARGDRRRRASGSQARAVGRGEIAAAEVICQVPELNQA